MKLLLFLFRFVSLDSIPRSFLKFSTRLRVFALERQREQFPRERISIPSILPSRGSRKRHVRAFCFVGQWHRVCGTLWRKLRESKEPDRIQADGHTQGTARAINMSRASVRRIIGSWMLVNYSNLPPPTADRLDARASWSLNPCLIPATDCVDVREAITWRLW